jgi:hypothetical protein
MHSRAPRDHSFVPAAGVDWLLPLYDPLNRLFGTHRYRERLIDAAAIGAGDRVLAPGGTVHVLDFGPPHGRLDRLMLGVFHREGEQLRDNLEGRIPALMTDAGLADARELRRMRSPFGTLAIWEAKRAG